MRNNPISRTLVFAAATLGFAVVGIAGCGSTTRATSNSTNPVATTAAPSPRTSPLTAAVTVPATTIAHVTAPPATQPPVTAAPVTSPPALTVSCHPLTNGGTCYEPGEFCRASDHGLSGVAGDLKNITCRNNNGWRWEPS